MLTLYNSFTRQKEVFTPIHPGKVGIYVCGMTVYDYCHIGHGRVLVAFDVITRYLRFCNYEVNYVRNITDIDDKIIQRANEQGETLTALTNRLIAAMGEDEAALHVLPPTAEPRATEAIERMIDMIKILIDKGFAYVGTTGDVYYNVEHFSDYGKLAHKELESLQAGARVAIVDAKNNPLDFVLWKMAKPNEPGWGSPWGVGRPGWHIECSAMSTTALGNHFDIHGGGFDLKFPHHENEIAQSEAATGEKFVNYWLHVGFVQVNKEKMSKSLGNFFLLREVFARYHPEVVRYFMVLSHYRSPVNYSEESLNTAAEALERLYLALRGMPVVVAPEDSTYEQTFKAAMDDDFNTPEALAVLFELTRQINRLRSENPDEAAMCAAILRRLATVLGFLQEDPESYLQSTTSIDEALRVKIEKLVDERVTARKNKDWARADEVRAELTALGVSLEDTAEGTLWRL